MTRIFRFRRPMGLSGVLHAGALVAVLGLAGGGAVAETLPWAKTGPSGTAAYPASPSMGGVSGGARYDGAGTTRPMPDVPGPSAQATGGYNSGGDGSEPAPDPYRPGTQVQPPQRPRANDAYSPTARDDAYSPNRAPASSPPSAYRTPDAMAPAYQPPPQRYGANRQIEPYQPDYGGNAGQYQNDYNDRRYRDDGGDARMPDASAQTYSRNV